MPKKDLAAIALAAALLLLPAAAAIDLFNPDEPREAEIAREMRLSGDLLVPHFNGCPFLEKPPLFYWAVLAASRLPGAGPELQARLPSVLAAIGLLLVVYGIGSELYGRRTGRAAAFVLLTTFQFWWLGKRALLDMTLAFFVGATMLCFLLGHRRPAERTRWLLLAGAAAAGAALTKGLIGLLIPGLAILFFLAWRRELRLLVTPAALAAAAVPLVAIGAWTLLLAARFDGACYVREFLVENHLKRFTGGGYGGHHQPPWYYLESLATDLQPWILFLPAALAALRPGWRSGERWREAFLFAWLLPPLVVLSLSSSKRSIYLLPIAPAIALLVAAWWRTRSRRVGRAPAGGAGRPPWDWAIAVPGAVLLLLGLLLAAAIPVFVAAILSGRTPRGAAALMATIAAEPAGVPAGAAMLVAVLAVALVARANGRRGARGTIALLWVFLLVAGVALLPLAEPRLSARQLGLAMEAERARGSKLAAWRLTEGSLGQFLFYSGGTVDWIGRGEGGAQNPCVDCRLPAAPAEYLAGPGRRALLTTEEGWSLLPPEARSGRVLARGRVGGAGYVLLAGPARAVPGP